MKILACIVTLVAAACAMPQDKYPEIPEDYYRAQVDARLKALGWYHGPQRGKNSKVTYSRVEYANGIIQTIESLQQHIEGEVLDMERRIATRKVSADLKSLIYTCMFLTGGLHVEGLMPGLRGVIDEYSAELSTLGSSKQKLLAALAACQKPLDKLIDLYEEAIRLRRASPQFKDVPSGHWAAKAVQELKDSGLLIGYPNGKFRGG
ncbi:MAG: S-layer homology domain-containing protein [Chlorobia bacterium]|nr:S-layer homology domain-containing protein [Fimbriimonadaceae bacterium]